MVRLKFLFHFKFILIIGDVPLPQAVNDIGGKSWPFLCSNARDAAFLNKAEPAMQPKTVGFVGLMIPCLRKQSMKM